MDETDSEGEGGEGYGHGHVLGHGDQNLDLAIANSLQYVNKHQITNNTFCVKTLTGAFLDCEAHKFTRNVIHGDGIILPSYIAPAIADLEINGMIYLSYELDGCIYYGHICDYISGDYAYVIGNITNDAYSPGQDLEFKIINRTMHVPAATHVQLTFDCDMHGIDFDVLLKPWIGCAYQCLVNGKAITFYGEDGSRIYTARISKIYSGEEPCPVAIAYNTDLEIDVVIPAPVCAEVEAVDGVGEEVKDSGNVIGGGISLVAKLTPAELRAQRLSYFKK